jgi:uncharacterized membrane protein YbhN (UPF0104 family)
MHAILAAVRSADAGELVLSGCCFAVALACSAASWRAMLGGGIRFPDACARYGAGSLANTFLPGRAGDAMRLTLFGRVVPGGTLAVAGAVAAVGAARWLALLPLGIAAALDDGLPARTVALAGLAVAPLLVAWLCARGGSRRARALLAPLRVADRATFAALAIWVSGTVLARIGAATLAGGALGVPHPLAAALLVVPALELAGIVPLTPANIGVAGGAAAFAFHANGLPAREAVAAGFALHGVETAAGLIVGSVCAAVLSWRGRHRFVTGRFPGRSPWNGGLVAASRGPFAISHQGGTMRKWTRRLTLVLVAAAAAGLAATTQAAVRGDGDGHNSDTRTPIRHLVVIFQENVSFDHYFGTYPTAANTGGQPFAAAPHTPKVAGLTPALLTSNPNSSQPARLDSSPTGLAGSAGGQLTCDQDHNYSDEQQAFDGGKMDQFVQSVGTAGGTSPFGTPCNPSIVMDYYDGNTVTAFWNYAQRYAMSDNSFSPTFGPSAPGAVTSSPATPGAST